MAPTLSQRIEEVMARLKPGVTLVAVTKTQPPEVIQEAYDSGLRVFGENYLQEFEAKRLDLAGAQFHFIGRLQSNKARRVGELFDVVETLDSAKSARRIEQPREVFLEVQLSDEKGGVKPAELPALIEQLPPHLRLTGLMTMPPWSEDPEKSRPYFARLRELAARHGLQKLSMGMSHDLEVAIEEGATHVRVGTALFGPRRP